MISSPEIRLQSELSFARKGLRPITVIGANVPDHDAPNMDHICLQVQPWDADAIRTHLTSHAVEVGEIVTRYGALGFGPSLYVRDPEGNTIELKGMNSSGEAG